jgi:hypothetical protein
VACTSSRYNDPELADVLPGWGEPFSFDAETTVDIVAEQFSIIEVRRWTRLSFGFPASLRCDCSTRSRTQRSGHRRGSCWRRCPLRVTKRGCLIWAHACNAFEPVLSSPVVSGLFATGSGVKATPAEE